MAAATASSVAGALGGVLFRAGWALVIGPACLHLPNPRRFLAGPVLHLSDVQRFSAHKLRASSSEETSGSIQTEELLADLKEKWDSIENKSTVFVYGGGAIVAVWLSSIVISAVNSVPLSSRKELAEDIESLKKKIAGTE
ncbi:hypothetical protein KFK09_005625 [Dendrobium nobile]|uniref:Uncharacterized protein n=1 Tax=Dendrobium nobile TaxID=94219 RepID=A0A8T3BYW4_DENNO|nr:hypothetical protein KFK09_005625 [Dendrobium nobile]